MGEILAALGRDAEARLGFERALALDPRNAEAQRGLCILYLAAGRPREAQPWLERAVAGDRTLADAWNALGVVQAQAGHVAKAVKAWRDAVAIDPSQPDVWFNLGLALERMGDRKGAAEAIDRCLPLVQGADRGRAEALLRRLRGVGGD